MRRVPADTKLYKMTLSQSAMVSLALFGAHLRGFHIPTFITFKKTVDPELMNRTLNEEIRRNDCLRLRFKRKLFGTVQYFAPAETEDALFPFVDFSGKTDEELERWLREEAVKPVRFRKGDAFRLFRLITPEGKFGLFFTVAHSVMDLYAVLTFYKDLMSVYDALENGGPLPPPLSRYEDIVRAQNEAGQQGEKPQKDLDYFEEYLRRDGPSFYAGIDRMRQLAETRVRKHDPAARYVDIDLPYIFRDRSKTLLRRIDRETTEKIERFCAEHRLSTQNLFYLGMRTYLSGVNELTDDVTFSFLTHRRRTAAEKNCGGCCTTMLPLRTVIGKNESFLGALTLCRKISFNSLRHLDAPPVKLAFLTDRIEHRRLGANSASMMFTVCPSHSFRCPDGWGPSLRGISIGYFPYIAYTAIIPCPADGGLLCQYEYRTNRFTEEELQSLHDGMLRVIELGLEDPGRTVGDILERL